MSGRRFTKREEWAVASLAALTILAFAVGFLQTVIAPFHDWRVWIWEVRMSHQPQVLLANLTSQSLLSGDVLLRGNALTQDNWTSGIDLYVTATDSAGNLTGIRGAGLYNNDTLLPPRSDVSFQIVLLKTEGFAAESSLSVYAISDGGPDASTVQEQRACRLDSSQCPSPYPGW